VFLKIFWLNHFILRRLKKQELKFMLGLSKFNLNIKHLINLIYDQQIKRHWLKINNEAIMLKIMIDENVTKSKHLEVKLNTVN